MNTIIENYKGGFVMNENLSTVGKRIEWGLEQLDIRPSEACRQTGISKNAMSNYINDKRVPNPDILIKLSELLNVSIDWLLKGNETNPTNENSIKTTNNQSKEEMTKYIKYAIEMGKRIADIRKDARLSLEDFATEIKCSPKNLEEYESGRQPVPAYILHNISKTFNILPSFLLDPDEVIDVIYEAEELTEISTTSSVIVLTECEKNILHFFKKLPKDEQEEIGQIIMMKHKKLTKKIQSSAWTNGEDEEAAAKELA